MKNKNRERVHVKLIKELAKEMDFKAQFLSEDWITVLRKGNIIHYIYGYDWGLNPSSAQLIAKDKTAAYEILKIHNINAIEHKLFFNYNLQAKYTGQNGCWEEILKYAEQHKRGDIYSLICKPNRGTGGNDIYRIAKRLELESTVHKMFSKYNDLCLSPYYEISNEYRLIYLNKEILLYFQKNRPYVEGNGKDNLLKLLTEKFGNGGLMYQEDLQESLTDIIPLNEKRMVSWKHNLGSGARAQLIEDKQIKSDLKEIADKTAAALGIKFASIDIVLANGEYYIMEVNSGIMLENFASQKNEGLYNYYETAKVIYRKAIELLFS